MRTLIIEDPYTNTSDTNTPDKPWQEQGIWPARWIQCPAVQEAPFVTAYRLRFTVADAAAIKLHVTADERYELFLDGSRVGCGSERGDENNWFFETYEFAFTPGEHIFVARVWSLGKMAAYAQMTVSPGFLLSPDDPGDVELLGTGVAPWETKKLEGYTFVDPSAAWGTGANLIIDGSRFDWDFERGESEGWQPVRVLEAGSDALRRNDIGGVHRLRPALLPPMLDAPNSIGTVRLISEVASLETHAIPIRAADHLADEQASWMEMLHGTGTVEIPAQTRRRILIDLENYYCAYPKIIVTGGAGSSVRIHWQESLFNEPDAQSKGDRSATEGKYFVTIWQINDGIGDIFLPDGGRKRLFETLWWQCGRYVEIVVETHAEPLTLESLRFRETRYPLENAGDFAASDTRLATVIPLAVRTVQMCAHETYMDCPYYEQLMYIGDTRLQALATYVMTQDDRLPRKALRAFDFSRLTSGLTQSRYPSRVRQIIPPFSLWWVAMVYDYALWRDDPEFVRDLLPGVRSVLDRFALFQNTAGLLHIPYGWNFADWVPSWDSGIPPDGSAGASGVLNWHFILILTLAAKLEAWAGEPERAARSTRLAAEAAARVQSAFWDEDRGLFADNLEKTLFSEHSQCLAILSGLLEPSIQAKVSHGLLQEQDLARATIYFTHYLFETFYQLGRGDAILERMGLWFDLAQHGLKTTIEMPEPTRSDCHAWGAHPLYHNYASLLGIRPGAPGFAEVRIAPQPGLLDWARGTLPHPRGEIKVHLQRNTERLHAEITLPEGITGNFVWAGQTHPLQAGDQTLEL